MDVDNADHLFGNPWKHFNLGDVLNDGVGGECPRQGERQREDDDDGDGEVLVDVSDSEAGDDAQRASGILSAIIEGNAQGECPYTAGGGADVDMEKLRLYKAVCDICRKFNSELVKMAQDRKYRFIMNKMFHSTGKSKDDTDIYDYYDEDDDVLFVEKLPTGEVKYVLANVEHVVVSNSDVPASATQHQLQQHIRAGSFRREVPLNYPHQRRVALYLRFYEEADNKGKALLGYGNARCKYYHLPESVSQPCEYRLAESVLGHVRLDPIKKIGRREVSRMYKEFVDRDVHATKPTDRTNLIEMHEQA